MANGKWGVYRGAVNLNDANDIQHWKYIRKYKTGDKWRYVYADENTHKNINNMYSKYQSTTENAKRYEEAAKKYDHRWDTAGLFQDKAAAKRNRENYYKADTEAAKNRNAAPRYYNAYIKNIENNSVSKILKDTVKSWKEKANKVFDRLKIEAKSLYRLHQEAEQKRNERKKYGVTIGGEIKNQIDYATDPYKWFDGPYKSLLTQRKEEEAAKRKKASEEAYKKNSPIGYYVNRKKMNARGKGGSSKSF